MRARSMKLHVYLLLHLELERQYQLLPRVALHPNALSKRYWIQHDGAQDLYGHNPPQ